MSNTNPLLKHAVPTTHSGSEAKVFFTADELLQHVRREYQLPADTRKQGKRYTRLRAVSPGLYVPDHSDTKQENSLDTKKKLRHDEAQLPKSQPRDTNMASFRADGSQHFSRSHSLARDWCGKNTHGAERKELRLEDKSQIIYQQHNNIATHKKTCATVKLDTKPNRGPQSKISWKSRTKTRRISQESYGSIQICFFKMSSLHSPRIQCCCCAVGVFAAMFGIFMLSAGICIVLNVTFMEVDTSGLPPDLHNEHGKKVVGIILICVAIAFLGLSATVSIMYFTLCSRKSPDVTKQQKTAPAATTTGQERVRSRESVLQGKKRATSSSLNVVPGHRPGMHLHSEFCKQKKSYHVLRNRPVLPPHQEEEADLSKSSTELNRVDETFSASTASYGKKRKLRDRKEESVESLDVHIISYSNIRTPVIVVDSFHEEELLGEDEMETQLNDSVLRFDDDGVSNTYSEQCEEINSGVPVFDVNVLISGITSHSSADSEGQILRHNDLSKLELKSHPDYLDTASIQTDLSSSSTGLVSSSCTSLPELQQQVLVVRPATDASLGSLTNIHSPIDRFSDEDRDSLSCLPVISDHQGTHTVLPDESQDGLNRVHHNSAFSFDGNDPPQQCQVEL